MPRIGVTGVDTAYNALTKKLIIIKVHFAMIFSQKKINP